MRSLTVLSLLAFALAAGCSNGDDNANGGLGGTTWTVVAIGGTSAIAASPPEIAFDVGGTVEGTDGCNRFKGRFRTERDRIALGDVVTTKIGCDAERSAQAKAFASALTGATGWRLTERGELELSGAALLVARPGVGPGGTGAVADEDRVR